MTRKSFFVRLVGMLGLAGMARGQQAHIPESPVEIKVHEVREPLKPGEEYCSLGHAQKPKLSYV